MTASATVRFSTASSRALSDNSKPCSVANSMAVRFQAQVPFVAALVPEVDLEAGRVVVDAPPGLLDLGV